MENTVENVIYRAPMPNNFDIPRRINRLAHLAYNLWWTWRPEAMRLFVTIDRDLWERTGHNPISFLREVERSRLNAMTQNRFFLERYDQVFEKFDTYIETQDTWFQRKYPELEGRQIAYFSMEFGLHETLAIYAGGLGVLSGDHLKEASDLGLPMVAIGFLYTRGYFSQRITEDGWQETRDYRLNISDSAIMPLLDSDGNRVTVDVELPERMVTLHIWKVQVGRIPLFLLDSDLESNTPADRLLTANLYSGNPEMRIQQEILLGIGGVRTLRRLGYEPTVWHMNEGHSAFLALERARELVEAGYTFEDILDQIRTTNVFTTHTPVPAGNDEFPTYLVDKYFAQFWPKLGLDREQFIALASCQRTSLPITDWKSRTICG